MDTTLTIKTGMLGLAAVALLAAAGCEPAATPKTGSTPAAAAPRSTAADQAASGDGRSEIARGGSKAATAVDDTAITAAVKAGILAEPGLKVLQIGVDTANGIVTLSGAVEEADSVKKAAQIASGVQGVRSVDNRLVVNSTTKRG
jgi:hyperosmotically inducible periplasmic protein